MSEAPKVQRVPRIALEPRLLSEKQAAQYLGLTVEGFRTEVPFRPLQIRAKKLWDRFALDAWVDYHMGKIQPEPLMFAHEEKLRLRRLDDRSDALERRRRRKD